ncbi:hypothetical protein CSBG_03527 [Clostridium sp. 7_2_43FAA]|nr:hypothetical protein CSBG_03527 [Clostridium sp. 7_2_43FAA]
MKEYKGYSGNKEPLQVTVIIRIKSMGFLEMQMICINTV